MVVGNSYLRVCWRVSEGEEAGELSGEAVIASVSEAIQRRAGIGVRPLVIVIASRTKQSSAGAA
jgi:hypothetical protein